MLCLLGRFVGRFAALGCFRFHRRGRNAASSTDSVSVSVEGAAAGINLGGIGLAPDRIVAARKHWSLRGAAISLRYEPHQLYRVIGSS